MYPFTLCDVVICMRCTVLIYVLFVNHEMIILSTLMYYQCQLWWLYSVYVPLYVIVAKRAKQSNWFYHSEVEHCSIIKSRLSCRKVNLCSVAGDKLDRRLLHISLVTEKRLSTAPNLPTFRETNQQVPATSESYSRGLSRTPADSVSTWTGFIHKE